MSTGYKGRDAVQLRLEDTGEVYLSYNQEHLRIVSATVSWDRFERLFRKLVDELAAPESPS